MSELLTIKEASVWATKYLNKDVTTSNISYLIQYAKILNMGKNGNPLVSIEELEKYYKSHYKSKEERWKEKLGKDLNWALSFSECKESETTKHVHRLHPYKGKFIPQLVEYFLDNHIDNFKQQKFFNEGDTVLDPFCGSGTLLVQANELGINAVGIDISRFNSQISNSKVAFYDIESILEIGDLISQELKQFLTERNNLEFESELLNELKAFNKAHFPSPEFKLKVKHKELNEKEFGNQKATEFLPIYQRLVEDYRIDLQQDNIDESNFLDKWFTQVIRDEIEFINDRLQRVDNPEIKNILSIILSRTIRSCRATTHSDLATLFEPQITPYYCTKHGKICKPLFSILRWWNRYLKDTVKRLNEFNELRTDTSQICLTGDSRNLDIIAELKRYNEDFSNTLAVRKIDGIFSSPPYVGVIDYHEQHAYAYDLFGHERNDSLEIGPLYNGQGKAAQKSYLKGIAEVLINCKDFLVEDYNVFLVANDKFGLYAQIAELAGMQIVNQYKRPVLNRVEKDRNAYSEIIFHLKPLQ